MAVVLIGRGASAAEYEVGPGKPYRTLQEVTALLHAGDVVTVEGGVTYPGGVSLNASGEPGQGVISVTGRSVNGARPVLSGVAAQGGAVMRVLGSHYLIQGFDMTTGGDTRANRCFYSVGNDVTLSNSVVHDSPCTGVSGADASGSLTLDHVEVCRCGNGLFAHQIYVGSSLAKYPDALFRMQFCYVHDGIGGNNVKSRVTRNQIEYNWLEGAFFHDLDLVGPDPKAQKMPKGGIHCDADIVGNVLVMTPASQGTMARLGSDGNAPSQGRYRFAYNTVIVRSNAAAGFGLFWLKGAIDSLAAWNNVFWSDAGPMKLVRQEPGPPPVLFGEGNWMPRATAGVPPAWNPIRGIDPRFTNASAGDYRPAAGSPLIGAGWIPPQTDIVATHIPPAPNAPANIFRSAAREKDIGAFPNEAAKSDAGQAGTQ